MRRTPSELALLALIAAWTGTPQAQTTSGPGAAPQQPRAGDAKLARALQDHDWTLQSATDAAGKPLESLAVPGHPFVMRVEGTRLSIRGDCNLMSGGWRLSAQNRLTVGRMATTQRACEPPLMAADAAIAAFLSHPLEAHVEPGEPPTLRLESTDGRALAFAGQRTAKSLYGAPTRIFLEIAAQRVPCTPALQPPTTCLEARERRFDEKGLPIGEPGLWRPFYADIRGYTHQPGVSNVLRINRYKPPRAPADGSAYVYELDLVVQSKVVDPK